MVEVQSYAGTVVPSREVTEALEAGVVEITRRVEIYESDATTRWYPEGSAADEVSRLISGTVSVDYNSDERRKLDLVLDNIDGLLRQNPEGGFWYDKVIKPYRGISYRALDVSPPVALIESQDGAAMAAQFSALLSASDLINIDVMLGQSDVGVLSPYSWIASVMSDDPTAISSTLKLLFDQGKNIITVGIGNGTDELPHYTSAPSGSNRYAVSPVEGDSPTAGAFVAEDAAYVATGTGPVGLAAGAQALAVWSVSGGSTIITAAIMRHQNGAIWLDFHLPIFTQTEGRKLFRAAIRYIRNIVPIKSWEAQLGEFYIDNLSEANFPNQMKVTARDATKKMMLSKLARTSTFVAGTSLKDLIVGQASLSGIPTNKMRINIGSEVLTSEMSFEKGTTRWDIIKGALESFNYERFMDRKGNFVVRQYLDPSTSPSTITFKTGPDGNLVSFDLSTNDSNIFNHIIVTATPSDNDVIPYFGEAINEDPSSPTRRSRLGDRVMPVDADWLSSDEECIALAQERLKIASLESYEVNFASIYYPWLECGEIIDILDPGALEFDPTRFLMDSISYPMDLGPMSATGKRITYVGSPG